MAKAHSHGWGYLAFSSPSAPQPCILQTARTDSFFRPPALWGYLPSILAYLLSADYRFELLGRAGYNVEYFPRLLYNSVDGINEDDMTYEERATDSIVQVMDGFEGRTAAIERNLLDVWSV